MSEKEAKALILLRVYGQSLSEDEFNRVTTVIKNMVERLVKENRKKDKIIDLLLDK